MLLCVFALVIAGTEHPRRCGFGVLHSIFTDRLGRTVAKHPALRKGKSPPGRIPVWGVHPIAKPRRKWFTLPVSRRNTGEVEMR